MSKKKSKNPIIEQADSFVAMLDAKSDHPQSFFERIFFFFWKILGAIYVPYACLILFGLIMVGVIFCIFIDNDLLHGAVGGASLSFLIITVIASIEHHKEKSLK